VERYLSEKGKLREVLPHYEYRPMQLKMAKKVKHALDKEKILVVEAPTGTGKTIAYLLASIEAKKKTVISTGTKNLQEQLIFKEIPLIKKSLFPNLKVALMKGRVNYLCLRRWKNFIKNPTFDWDDKASVFSSIEKWVTKTETGDRSELIEMPEDYPIWWHISSKSELCFGLKCPYFKECFITKMRQIAASSDIIVVNHHLFFADLSLKGVASAAVIPSYEAIIFDEAHQIEKIAADFFGFMVGANRIYDLLNDIKQKLSKNKRKDWENNLSGIERSIKYFFSLFPITEEKYRLKNELITDDVKDTTNNLFNQLDQLSARLHKEKDDEEWVFLEQRTKLIKEELEYILFVQDDEYVKWVEPVGENVIFHASPIDVSLQLRQNLYSKEIPIIFTSGTLSVNGSFSYFKKSLGLDPDIDEVMLDTPFDYKKNCLLYLPKEAPEPSSDEFILFLIKEIKELLTLSKGRAFVLFTSIKNMKEVYHVIRDQFSFPIYIQGEMPKTALLDRFRKEVSSSLFATFSFWEGVDVPGESLSCVIIDKLPFEVPTDPVIEAKIEKIKNDGGNPFFEFQIPRAVLELKQGIGRLLRTKNDKGVVAILDVRLRMRGYGKIFIGSFPSFPITIEKKDIENFFNRLG